MKETLVVLNYSYTTISPEVEVETSRQRQQLWKKHYLKKINKIGRSQTLYTGSKELLQNHWYNEREIFISLFIKYVNIKLEYRCCFWNCCSPQNIIRELCFQAWGGPTQVFFDLWRKSISLDWEQLRQGYSFRWVKSSLVLKSLWAFLTPSARTSHVWLKQTAALYVFRVPGFH